MSENKENEVKEEVKVETIKEEVKAEVNANTAEIKNEAKETVKQVKEKMKDVNIKEEAKATKGFISALVKEPLEKIKEIATDSSNKHFKTAIILVIVWTVATLLNSYVLKYFNFDHFFNSTLSLVKTLVAPALAIVGISLVVFVLSRKSEEKKSLITIITAITTAKLPIILAEVVSLLKLISSEISRITGRIESLASAISMVMMFFAIKELLGKKEEKDTLKSFAIVYAIYMVVSLVVSFLGIYIY